MLDVMERPCPPSAQPVARIDGADLEHYKEEAKRLRADAIADAFRWLGAALRRVARGDDRSHRDGLPGAKAAL